MVSALTRACRGSGASRPNSKRIMKATQAVGRALLGGQAVGREHRRHLALLASAVEKLPTRCRQVFTLRKAYGFSQKEIAERMQISENTVEQHLTKAARRCAQALFESPRTAREDNGMFSKLRRRMKIYGESA